MSLSRMVYDSFQLLLGHKFYDETDIKSNEAPSNRPKKTAHNSLTFKNVNEFQSLTS